MAKPRMTNEHKNWLRDNLIGNMEHAFYMTHEDAVEAVTGGSVPMFVDIARRMVRNSPQYATTHSFGPDAQDWYNAVRKAVGEWIAYKAGVRHDENAEAPAEASSEATTATDTASSPETTTPAEAESSSTEPAPAEPAVETTEETAPDTL